MSVAIAVSALVVALWQHTDAGKNKKELPLKDLPQLIKGIIWIVTAILRDRNPPYTDLHVSRFHFKFAA